VSDEAPRRFDRQGAAAVALRLAGAPYADIAEALALASVDQARSMVIDDLAGRVSGDERALLRAEEAARLERLLRSVWGKATNPEHPEHLPAAKVALAIVDRHVRLHGLDAPAEIVVHTPTMAEIDAWVASMNAAAVAPYAALEAPVVEVTEAHVA
jgi:hypothetical protein